MTHSLPQLTRQQFLRSGAAALATSLVLPGCSSAGTADSYDAVVAQTWRPSGGKFENAQALKRELVRHACLAPNSHNTQAWKFRIEEAAISVLPDLARRTPVVDPDDHHLFVSLGCAVENMAHAALAFGLNAQMQFDNTQDIARVKLEPTKALASPLYRAITERQSTRGLYDGKPLSAADLALLEKAGYSAAGVRVLLITAKPEIEKTLSLILEGNTAQMNDAAFVKELKQWLRFSGSQAAKTGDGLYSAASGNPSLPPWLGSRMFDLMFRINSENDKVAEQVRSSSGLAIFISDVDDKTHWLEAGRCYERFALQATSMGIRNAMLNQAVEVPAVRRQLKTLLGLQTGRPDLVVRFGRGEKMPRSVRRPLEDVLL